MWFVGQVPSLILLSLLLLCSCSTTSASDFFFQELFFILHWCFYCYCTTSSILHFSTNFSYAQVWCITKLFSYTPFHYNIHPWDVSLNFFNFFFLFCSLGYIDLLQSLNLSNFSWILCINFIWISTNIISMDSLKQSHKLLRSISHFDSSEKWDLLHSFCDFFIKHTEIA